MGPAPGTTRYDALLRWIAPFQGDPVTTWRHRLLATLLAGLSGLVLLPYTIGVLSAVRTGAWLVVVIDTAALALLLGTVVARRAPYALRASLVVILPMVLGTYLLARYGFATSGFVWLFVGPVVASLLFGSRGSLTFLGLMAVILLAIGVGLARNALFWPLQYGGELRAWGVTSATLVALGIIVCLSIGRIFTGLAEEALARRDAEAAAAREHQLASIGLATSSLAHDVNNLLQPMLADLELLRHDGTLAPEQQRLLDRLIGQTAAARTITRRSLRFARPDGLTREILALPDLIPETVRSLQAVVPPGVTLSLAPVPELRMAADPAALQQLLLMIVSQAAGHPGGAGRLEVVVSEAQVSADHLTGVHGGTLSPGAQAASLLVLYRDEESPDELDRLEAACRPLRTTELDTQPWGRLRPVASAVEALGGILLLRHRGGAHACLRVLLPTTDAPMPALATGEWRVRTASDDAPAARADTASGMAADPRRTEVPREACPVLVVDDDPGVLQSTARLVGRLGHRVLTEQDPRAVRARLEEERLGLLITDVSMPGLDGWELARQVRAAHPSLPILLMTGHMDVPGVDEGGHPTVDAYLAKPFTSGELQEAIVRAQGNRQRALAQDPALPVDALLGQPG